MTFADFNFVDSLYEGLQSMGYKQPSPIQELAIPIILNNKDLIACAQTGTGKTAAYLLPILHKIVNTPDENRHLNTLILAPTRELAQQIDNQIEGFAYFTSVSSIPVYGGGDGNVWERQSKALKQGADIIIATPGRLIALLQMGNVKLDKLQHLILDEADKMLDMGFAEDIVKIISYLPKNKQTILFSATMPAKIRTLANKILVEPETVNIAISQPAEGILQQAYLTFDKQKLGLVVELFKQTQYPSAIIFASTKENVKQLEYELLKGKMSVKAFHSDLEQNERESILREFRNKQVQILIGTDILSRGIDIEGISLVLNYDVPGDPEDYIHRIGRTARASSTGTAITFINEKDQQKFSRIEKMIDRVIEKLEIPSFLGESPLYEPETKVKKSFKKKKKSWKKEDK